MQRRDFVKAIVAATVAAQAATSAQPVEAQQTLALPPPPPRPPAPEPWMRGLLEVKPLPMTPLVPDAVAQTNADFFSETQTATLRHFCEILQPPYKAYPGAIEAGAPEFLDFLVGASLADRQQMYTSGLDRLESDARQHFQKPFAALNASEADKLIRPYLRNWLSDHPPTEPFERFINIAHQDIRLATVNSEAWNAAARAAGQQSPNVDLYWFPIDPDLHRSRLGSAT
jgi:hypothetical protein